MWGRASARAANSITGPTGLPSSQEPLHMHAAVAQEMREMHISYLAHARDALFVSRAARDALFVSRARVRCTFQWLAVAAEVSHPPRLWTQHPLPIGRGDGRQAASGGCQPGPRNRCFPIRMPCRRKARQRGRYTPAGACAGSYWMRGVKIILKEAPLAFDGPLGAL